MKVVCINNDGLNGYSWELDELEIGRVYDAQMVFNKIKSDNSSDLVYIEGKPMYMWYPVEMFISLEDYRENRISKIID